MHKPPLIIAHRGASGTKPENTIAAFKQAILEQADGFELDIFLTRDQKIVVTHDENTKRLTGEVFEIRKSHFAELRQLNFGSGEKIPTLDEVFEEFLPQLKIINVEIKSTGLKSDGIELALAQTIKKHAAENKIIVSSFNPLNLWRFKRIRPDVKIGRLLCEDMNFFAKNIFWSKFLKPDTINLDYTLIKNKAFISYVKTPKPLWLWTINSQEQWQQSKLSHVEAIITNFPALARTWIQS